MTKSYHGKSYSWFTKVKIFLLNLLIGLILSLLSKTGLGKFIEKWFSLVGFKKDTGGWKFKEYKLSWERKNVLGRIVQGEWLWLSMDIGGDLLYILKYYIHQKKENLDHRSNSGNTNKLNTLSAPEMDNLLNRLFTTMGYAIQKNDQINQKSNLTINLGEQKILLLAKLNNLVPLEGIVIQDALTMQKQFGSNGVMIISNGDFSKEAITLANTQMIGLVNKSRLSELLFHYLKEDWS
jgi:hypothetical protein